jgi:hypothetical protein
MRGAPNTILLLIIRQYYAPMHPAPIVMADRTRKKKLLAHNDHHCLLAEGDIGAPIYRRSNAPRHYYWRTDGFTHRVGRVLSFSPIVGIGTPPTPQPQAIMPPFRVEGHTHSQFQRGDINCGTLEIYVLCGFKKRQTKQFGAPRLFSSQLPINWALQTGNGNTVKKRWRQH